MLQISKMMLLPYFFLSCILASNIKIITFRLLPEMDLKAELLKAVKKNNFRAATIVTCVGSLRSVNIRLATANINAIAEINSTNSSPNNMPTNIYTKGFSNFYSNNNSFYEIVSLVGTIESSFYSTDLDDDEIDINDLDTSNSYGHIHISLSDQYGNVIGGHLMNGNLVYTTAEITIIENYNLEFTRKPCVLSGYDELVVMNRESIQFYIKNIFINLKYLLPIIVKKSYHLLVHLYKNIKNQIVLLFPN